jgi:Flp pilus assembly protein TadG
MSKKTPNRKNLPTGQGLIEFALVMPLLLLMVMAIIDFSRVFYIYSASSNATREAIRIGMTAPNDCDAIENAARSQFAFIPRDAYTVKITYDDGQTVKYNSCQADQSFAAGDRVLVDVRADFSPLTPFISNMFPKFTLHYDAARTIAYSGEDVPPIVPPPPSNPPTATPTATSGPTPTATATPKHFNPTATAVGGTPSPTVPVPTATTEPSPTATVPPATPSAAVSPLSECTIDNGNGTFKAYFGYQSANPGPVTIPAGADNGFSPDPADRGQPTTFQTGRTPYWPNAAFNTTFSGGSLVWTLKGGGQTNSATASADSSPCSQQVYIEKEWYDMEGNKLSGPPAGLSASYAITAQSTLGTAICTYPTGSSTLSCTYSNRKSGSRPALDDNGLWAPVGTTYTVTESGLSDGWVNFAGTGAFTSNVGGYCVNGRGGAARYCTHLVKNSPPQLNVAFVSGYPYRVSGNNLRDVYARVIVTSGGSPVGGVNITFVRFTHTGGSSTYTATTNASGYACALLDKSSEYGEMVNVTATKTGYQNGGVGGYTLNGGSGGCP